MKIKNLSSFTRCLLLALGYAVFWTVLHYAVTGARMQPLWLVPQILSSALIFFCFNALFVSFNPYKYGRFWQGLVSIIYVQPIFQLAYFQNYKAFLDQPNFSLLIREPFFLLKVFVIEFTLLRTIAFLLVLGLFWFINSFVLRPTEQRPPGPRAFDFFLNRWALLFSIVMIALQVKWCIEMDLSQLAMRPFYVITLMALISFCVYLVRSKGLRTERALIFLLMIANLSQLYILNVRFLDSRGLFTADQIFYRGFFGAFYIQSAFGDLEQNDTARAKFSKLPVAQMDYNILISLNDAQRWDRLSSNGYSKPTDEELDWFYKKSFNFQFPISPANFTDTAVPALLYGMGSDQDMQKFKSSLPFWDYFAKGAETFFISSQDTTWAKLNLLYASIGQKHVWSATKQPGYKGNGEDTIDVFSYDYLKKYLPTLTKPWVGVWQTYASHYPFTVEKGFERYLPCDKTRESGIPALENCYLNAQVYSAHLRSELFKTLDLDKTIVVLTSDHGEGMNEHGVLYHGLDYHQEMVKVPFNFYIPPKILAKLPAEAVANFKANLHHVVSTMDLVPSLLHLHEMLTGQKLAENYSDFSGRSLFLAPTPRVVFSTHCFPQYRCYSREILFATDDYYVTFKPSEGFYKIYDTWKDPQQLHALDFSEIDLKKFEFLIEESARIHPFGQGMKAYYEHLKANGFKAF